MAVVGPVACMECEAEMHRVYTVPQICTQPLIWREENKFMPGLSDKERLEVLRQDDKDFERHQNYVPDDLGPGEEIVKVGPAPTRDEMIGDFARIMAGGK